MPNLATPFMPASTPGVSLWLAEVQTGDRTPSVSVVLPCLDEASCVAEAVHEALEGLRLAKLPGEVIVVDNGSTDGSHGAAASAGARVVTEQRRGYGAAIRRGLEIADGDVIVFADADRSYDLRELGLLVQQIMVGAELVIGSRVTGSIELGAMPWLHRRVGTPALNLLIAVAAGRWFDDSQSGFRAIRRDRLSRLQLNGDGMEFASEMLVRAHQAGLRIAETPIRYRRRVGSSKLRPVGDGLRHLRLLLCLGGANRLTRRTRWRSSSNRTDTGNAGSLSHRSQPIQSHFEMTR